MNRGNLRAILHCLHTPAMAPAKTSPRSSGPDSTLEMYTSIRYPLATGRLVETPRPPGAPGGRPAVTPRTPKGCGRHPKDQTMRPFPQGHPNDADVAPRTPKRCGRHPEDTQAMHHVLITPKRRPLEELMSSENPHEIFPAEASAPARGHPELTRSSPDHHTQPM